MVDEAETHFKQQQSKLRGNLTPEQLAKNFATKVQRDGVTRAIRWLCDRDGGTVLSPDDIDSKSKKPVSEVLIDKHPELRRDVAVTTLEEYNSVPEFQEVIITDETVERVAKKLTGSAGLVNFDSTAMKRLLLNHGGASRALRHSIAKFASWLSNENVPWAVHRGLMMCREVALDKMPGVRPLGIGDIL